MRYARLRTDSASPLVRPDNLTLLFTTALLLIPSGCITCKFEKKKELG